MYVVCWVIVDTVFVCNLGLFADIFSCGCEKSLVEVSPSEAWVGSHVQISIGFITGFLMCLMLAPGSLGLKGAQSAIRFWQGEWPLPLGCRHLDAALQSS